MGETIQVALCDDARAVKSFLRHVLEEDGDIRVVSSTSTGRAAAADLARHHPAVLLLDVLLPDVPDTGDLVQELRRRSPATAIVLISNMPPVRLQEEADRVGADGWLLKASGPDDFREAVRQAVAAAR
jgi:DNA-binding NarL/FixJ family response regulator